jgi:hypothetical protein
MLWQKHISLVFEKITHRKPIFRIPICQSFWQIRKSDSDRALTLLIPIPTMYHCEACLSRVANIKRKARNRLDLNHDVGCALAMINFISLSYSSTSSINFHAAL